MTATLASCLLLTVPMAAPATRPAPPPAPTLVARWVGVVPQTAVLRLWRNELTTLAPAAAQPDRAEVVKPLPPFQAVHLTVKVLAGQGIVRVVQQPAADNHYNALVWILATPGANQPFQIEIHSGPPPARLQPPFVLMYKGKPRTQRWVDNLYRYWDERLVAVGDMCYLKPKLQKRVRWRERLEAEQQAKIVGTVVQILGRREVLLLLYRYPDPVEPPTVIVVPRDDPDGQPRVQPTPHRPTPSRTGKPTDPNGHQLVCLTVSNTGKMFDGLRWEGEVLGMTIYTHLSPDGAERTLLHVVDADLLRKKRPVTKDQFFRALTTGLELPGVR